VAWKVAEGLLADQPAAAANESTISALVAQYERSAAYKQLRQITRDTYHNWMKRLVNDYGKLDFTKLERRHVRGDLDKISSSPSVHNARLRAWRQILNFAVERDLIATNPASGIKKLKEGAGHRDWPDTVVDQYRAHWRLGTRERLHFDVFRETGQRLRDVAVMTDEHLKVGEIWLTQSKTSSEMVIPITKALSTSITMTERTSNYLVETIAGNPYAPKSLSNIMAKRFRDAGIPAGYSVHGLRKAKLRTGAERGMTENELMALSGHKTPAELERYTKGRDQRRLAKQAIKKEEE